MKFRILCAALFILSFCGFAEKIPFVWHTGFNDKDTVVPVEWNEKWFGQKSAFEYNHDLARLSAFFSVAAYSDVVTDRNSNNLLKNYSLIGIQKKDVELHYDMNYDDSMWGNDQVAFSIASKEINSSKGRQTLVIVSIRGTPLNANEWLSNLNISDTTQTEEIIHNGFGKATLIVHSALISYLLRHRIDPTDSFILVTGHSRGAAVANLLSAKIVEDKLNLPTRSIELSLIQRADSILASKVDHDEAIECSKLAFESALKGETGKMVGVIRKSNNPYTVEYKLLDISKIANVEKTVPFEMIGGKTGMTDAFKKYLRPLIQGEIDVKYKDGIVETATLEKHLI